MWGTSSPDDKLTGDLGNVAALGATALQGLHAQAKPPAYFVIEINKVTDAEGFKVITQRPTGGADVAKGLGGHYIARTDKITALDGTAPQRFIAMRSIALRKHKPLTIRHT
jgi:hypothetical protein